MNDKSYLTVYNHGIPEQLTAREYQVLEHLADGESTAMISEGLFISDATTRNHIQAIMVKMGVHSRLAAVAAMDRTPDEVARVIEFCRASGIHLSGLQRTLIRAALLADEGGCKGDGLHEWLPRSPVGVWSCVCGEMTVA